MGSPVFRKLAEKSAYTLLDSEPPRADFLPPSHILAVKKKKPGSRKWMRFDSSGVMEVLELDRNAIMQRASIPARDLRILGPIFSQSSHILARERAMVVNLEFIKAIVTAEELFLLESTSPAFLPFVEQLKENFPATTSQPETVEKGTLDVNIGHMIESHGAHMDERSLGFRKSEGLPDQLPFEFRVLEIALDFVCHFLEGRVKELERKAYPTLDEFTRNITSSNLELVRNIKSHLTLLTGQVQKVRDELEQLLDDDEDMGDLYLTRKLTQWQHINSPSASFQGDSRAFGTFESFKNFTGATSLAGSDNPDNGDVEELEMLLEAYFMQLDGTLNKLTMIREYIDDTEDYINIQLDHQRNELFQFQVTLAITALVTGIATAACGAVSMNIYIPTLYESEDIFVPFVASVLSVSVLLFCGLIGFVYWTGLFER